MILITSPYDEVRKVICDIIKNLREQSDCSQAQLARQLGITRSSVNAWEMGISVPSTQYIVELAKIFRVSTDFLLGVNSTSTVDVSGLCAEDIELVTKVVAHLRKINSRIE